MLPFKSTVDNKSGTLALPLNIQGNISCHKRSPFTQDQDAFTRPCAWKSWTFMPHIEQYCHRIHFVLHMPNVKFQSSSLWLFSRLRIRTQTEPIWIFLTPVVNVIWHNYVEGILSSKKALKDWSVRVESKSVADFWWFWLKKIDFSSLLRTFSTVIRIPDSVISM